MKYEREIIRIASDLDPRQPWLEGHEYVDCQLHGPAILAIVDNVHLKSNTLDGSADALLWRLNGRKLMIGCIGVRDCSFRRCVFVGVGFTGDDAFLRRLRRDLTITTTEADRIELPWWQRIMGNQK